jgi:multiple sugar transport system ATP-binding protein
MARVKLEGVRKVYDDGRSHVAVHGVDLEVRDGEFVVLVGPSGCGKSTTLRMIAGLESITDGKLWIGDRLVNDISPRDRDIAMVFQSYALYPHMSVFENMAFGLRRRKLPAAEIDRRVRQAAGILGIEAILDRTPRQLSGGQRQRVAVGRAIVRQPQVFLFDEPLSNLDAKLRVQTRREISKLHRELGATMIYVTHDQVEAMTMGDRIVVLNEGRVQQIDTPLALYRSPVNRFVAGFIGSPAMNFIEGRISTDGHLHFRATDNVLSVALPASRGPALAKHAGSAVILGVRPEDVHVAAGLRPPSATPVATLTLDAVEPMGNEVFFQARSPGYELTARVPPQPLPPVGHPIELSFDAEKLHFFDGASGGAIAQ